MGDFLQRFNYYGFNKEIYGECRKLIIKSNLSHAWIITLWFALMNAFYCVSAGLGLFNVDPARQGFYLAFMLLSLLIMLLILFVGRRSPVFGIVFTALDLVMFEVYSILSSNAEPYTTCWVFLILMVIVALSFVETMGGMCAILLVLSIVFCRLSYLNKPRSIASMDLANTVVVASLALVLHFAFQRSRVNEFAATIRDIKTQRKLEINSSFDQLTGLLNRGRFFSMTEQLLGNRHGDGPTALALIDLDEFKQINDNLGHQTGDLALSLTAKTIIEILDLDLSDAWEFPDRVLKKRTSFAGRLGGDEFIILLQGFDSREEMMKTITDLLEALHRIRTEELHGLKASIGITMIQGDENTVDAAYRRADEALYVSKENGRNQINVNQF